MRPREGKGDHTPMMESFEDAAPYVEAADSSLVAPGAETPPKRLKLFETGAWENALETPPAEPTPAGPLPSLIEEGSVRSMTQVVASLHAQIRNTLEAMPHSGPAPLSSPEPTPQGEARVLDPPARA